MADVKTRGNYITAVDIFSGYLRHAYSVAGRSCSWLGTA